MEIDEDEYNTNTKENTINNSKNKLISKSVDMNIQKN